MPYTVTREKHGVYQQFTGNVTPGEFLESIFKTQADPNYERMRYAINDFMSIEGHDVLPTHFKIAAAHCLGAELTNPKLRIAWVTADPDLCDMALVFCALTNCPCEIFRTLSEARGWVE